MSKGADKGGEMLFPETKQLVNLGNSGVSRIHKGCKAYGDISNITGGELGSELRGNISEVSGVVNKRLSGDATGVKIHLHGGETGDIRQVAEERRREKEMEDTLSRVLNFKR